MDYFLGHWICFPFFFFYYYYHFETTKEREKIRGHGEAWELRNVKWFTRRTEETFLATFISLTCVGRVYATRTSRIFCSVHKKKRSLECYNKLYLLTASVFVHRDSVLTLARCFPRFKRDYSSFIIFFLSLSRNISLLVSSFKPVQRIEDDRNFTEIDEILRFISDFFFHFFQRKKKKNWFKIRTNEKASFAENNFSRMEIV